jgi:hypothetical protein
MRRFRTFSLVALLAVSAAACAPSYPASTVSQGTRDSIVWVSGAPAGARVLVDGVDAGEAARFDGRVATLTVPPGRHSVEIVSGGTLLYSQILMLASGTRVEVKVR